MSLIYGVCVEKKPNRLLLPIDLVSNYNVVYLTFSKVHINMAECDTVKLLSKRKQLNKKKELLALCATKNTVDKPKDC